MQVLSTILKRFAMQGLHVLDSCELADVSLVACL